MAGHINPETLATIIREQGDRCLEDNERGILAHVISKMTTEQLEAGTRLHISVQMAGRELVSLDLTPRMKLLDAQIPDFSELNLTPNWSRDGFRRSEVDEKGG
jgi:hypothetical protein